VVTVVDAIADRWDDLAEIMGTRGEPSRCWCQWFRLTNAQYTRSSQGERCDALRAQTESPVAPGVIAYDDEGTPRGWCAVARRVEYARLKHEDGAEVWAVTCFVVRVGSRRQGLTTALLDGAIDLARRHGARVIEAQPIDMAVKTVSSADLYRGPLSLFLRAGFREVGERSAAHRPLVQLSL